jgi:hypothetical protein
MEQAWQLLMQGRKEGERTLDVSEAQVTRENRQQCWRRRNGASALRMGSNVWKMHDKAAEGAKNLRKGCFAMASRKADRDERPTQASDEAEQKARTARGHRSKDGGHASSERKTPRTGVASKVEGDGPTR